MSNVIVKERLTPLFYFLTLLVILTIVLGGSNLNNIPANAILQLAAVPVLAAALYRLLICPSIARDARTSLFLLGSGLLVPLAQLAPLPEALWRWLPFRDLAGSVLILLGAPPGGGPISLAPFLTAVSYLTLLPALTIFLAVLSFNTRERVGILMVFNGMALASAFLGLLQFSQNSPRGAYLYADMGAGDVVGFFANRNHFAALMYAATPFSVAWILMALRPPQERGVDEVQRHRSRTTSGRRSRAAQSLWDLFDWRLLFAGVAGFFILVVACVMARSRAGVALLMLTLVAVSLLPNWRGLRSTGPKVIGSKALAALAGFSLLFALEYGFSRLLARFEADPLQDARVTIAKNTWGTALKALPTGTGLGTFQQIYGAMEPTRDVISYAVVNHAHNDYLELALETGAPGIAIIVVFLAWLFFRSRDIWRAYDETSSIYLTRAASLTIGLLLLHSSVDYPLRTHALMGAFAMCCALLAPQPVTPQVN